MGTIITFACVGLGLFVVIVLASIETRATIDRKVTDWNPLIRCRSCGSEFRILSGHAACPKCGSRYVRLTDTSRSPR